MLRSLFFLFIISLAAAPAVSHAQCTPNPANMTLITPDTVTNFVSGMVGQPYQQLVYVHPPADTMANVPPFGNLTVNIDDITIDNFVNLPPGLNYTCTPSSCIFPGGVSGCGDISGTPTLAGTYDLEIAITTNGSVVVIGQTIPVSQQDTIRSYRIIIDPSSVGIAVQSRNEISEVYGLYSENGMVGGIIRTNRLTEATLTVFDLYGHVVTGTTRELSHGDNTVRMTTGTLAAGVYLFTVRSRGGLLTRRFVVPGN